MLPEPEVQEERRATGWDLVGGVRVRCTGRGEGDMHSDRSGTPQRRQAVVPLVWSVPRQVHGSEVVVVDQPGVGAGVPADALVTRRPDVAIAVLSADCAPVALASPEGIAGVAHAGWRGLHAGVIEATVAAMRALGATDIHALLGPCIRRECYAFGPDDLDTVAARLGDEVRAIDRNGAPALDIPAGVAAAVAGCGATLVVDTGICTACGTGHWSWRARQDTARQATVAWRP